ncbi:MAG TPA: hypothetical protein VIN37_02780 [Candidatus Limnocylindria bacterium]
MAAATKITQAVASLMADAGIGTISNSGFVKIYDATGGVPATADTALTTQVLLATLTLNADAFPAAVNGLLTANAITQDSSADATGTAAFFRVTKSDGTVLWQGTCGTAAADMILNSVAISAGAAVQVSSLTYTVQLG